MHYRKLIVNINIIFVVQLLLLPERNSHHLFFGSNDIAFINSIKSIFQINFSASPLHDAALSPALKTVSSCQTSRSSAPDNGHRTQP